MKPGGVSLNWGECIASECDVHTRHRGGRFASCYLIGTTTGIFNPRRCQFAPSIMNVSPVTYPRTASRDMSPPTRSRVCRPAGWRAETGRHGRIQALSVVESIDLEELTLCVEAEARTVG